MAICYHCQSTIPDTARTCVICGQDIVPQEDVAAPSPIPSPTAGERFPLSPQESAREGEAIEPPALTSIVAVPLSAEVAPTVNAFTPSEGALTPVPSGGPAEAPLALADDSQPASMPVETDLGTLVGAYAVIGAYSAGLVGLFMPLCIVLGMIFADENWLVALFLAGIVGAIVWVPLSVIVAIVLGVIGLGVGLGVGVVAAVIFRLSRSSADNLQSMRVLVAILNAAAFGGIIVWLYSVTFHRIFPEFTALPVIFGVAGALSGLIMGLISPEKLQDNEPLSDEEAEAAKQAITAPFRLWRGIATRATNGSLEVLAPDRNADPNEQEMKRLAKDLERINKKFEQEQRKAKRAEKEYKEQMERIKRGDFR